MRKLFIPILILIGYSLIFNSCKRQTLNSEETFDVSLNDTLEYENFIIDTTDVFCTSKYKNCPHAKISYSVFVTKDTGLNAYLNNEVKKILLYSSDTTEFPTIYAYINRYFVENRALKAEGDYDNESSAWENENTIIPLPRIGNYFTLVSNQYTYEGGAHPNSYTTFKTYDITNRKELKINELLLVKDTALLRIGESYFRKENKIADTSSLADAAFFIFGEGDDFEESTQYGKFHFNDNFALTKNGIQFLYNNYEIGPYAVGASSFIIPYEVLKPYLKLAIW